MGLNRGGVCVDCGSLKPIMGRGRCVRDYFRFRQRKIVAGDWTPQKRNGDPLTRQVLVSLPGRTQPVVLHRGKLVRVAFEGVVGKVERLRGGMVSVCLCDVRIGGRVMIRETMARRMLEAV